MYSLLPPFLKPPPKVLSFPLGYAGSCRDDVLQETRANQMQQVTGEKGLAQHGDVPLLADGFFFRRQQSTIHNEHLRAWGPGLEFQPQFDAVIVTQ
jgi:hypothetical protein